MHIKLMLKDCTDIRLMMIRYIYIRWIQSDWESEDISELASWCATHLQRINGGLKKILCVDERERERDSQSDQGFTVTRWVHMNEELEPIRRPNERKNAMIVAAVSRWSASTCLRERERDVNVRVCENISAMTLTGRWEYSPSIENLVTFQPTFNNALKFSTYD